MSRLVVVGGGLAGAKAAEAATGTGWDVVVVGDERHAPYERPPLSKEVLRGEKESEPVHPEPAYDLLTGTAVAALDPLQRRVTLADGKELSYDAAVVATGTSPRRLGLPGAERVRYLRTVDDARALREAAASATRVAVIGAGWIGSEVAASLRHGGTEVVLVDPMPAPLFRVLGEQVGGVFARLHERHGVALRLGSGVSEVTGEGVVLADGTVERADLVVAGIGVVPNVSVAEAAGLDVNDGIVTDEFLRTSAPGVWAAGDVASAWHPRYGEHVRVEHWANALNQGTAAGRNATGGEDAYDRLPYFFSDQYDLGMEYVGRSLPTDEVTLEGDDTAFVATWRRDGRVTAAMHANTWDATDRLKELVAADLPA
jgi:3-phenylpropionate/trans-cinnamate dioxygenase ferredoxin reductase subunit